MKFKDFLAFGAIAPLVAPALPFIGAAALLKKDQPKPQPQPQAQPALAPTINITIINNGQPSQIGLDNPSAGGPAASSANSAAASPASPANPASPTSPAAQATADAPATGAGDFDLAGLLAGLTKLLASLTDILGKLTGNLPATPQKAA